MSTEDRESRFRELVVRHAPSIVAYVKRRHVLIEGVDADDIVAEVFATAWNELESIPPDFEVAWLIRTARNRIGNVRSLARRRERIARQLWTPILQGSPEDTVGEKLEIERALQTLSTADQEVLKLAAWEGLSAREIAEVIGISEGAANVRLSRAKSRFMSELARNK